MPCLWLHFSSFVHFRRDKQAISLFQSTESLGFSLSLSCTLSLSLPLSFNGSLCARDPCDAQISNLWFPFCLNGDGLHLDSLFSFLHSSVRIHLYICIVVACCLFDSTPVYDFYLSRANFHSLRFLSLSPSLPLTKLCFTVVRLCLFVFPLESSERNELETSNRIQVCSVYFFLFCSLSA